MCSIFIQGLLGMWVCLNKLCECYGALQFMCIMFSPGWISIITAGAEVDGMGWCPGEARRLDFFVWGENRPYISVRNAFATTKWKYWITKFGAFFSCLKCNTTNNNTKVYTVYKSNIHLLLSMGDIPDCLIARRIYSWLVDCLETEWKHFFLSLYLLRWYLFSFREDVLYQIGCFFTHCVNGPCPPPSVLHDHVAIFSTWMLKSA